MTASPSPSPPRRLALLAQVIVALGISVLGTAAMIPLFGFLGYGWDMPKGRAIPVFILYFLAGMAALQRGRSTRFRVSALILATILAVPAWWLTPQDHVSLREAGKWRDELKAEFSLPPTWDQAFRVDDIVHKYANLHSASRSMALALPMDDEGWADRIGEAILERFRTLPPEDIDRAIETNKAHDALFMWFPAATMNPSIVWVQRAFAFRIDELTRLPEADWAGFDRSATHRLRLAEAVPLRHRDLDQIIAAEEKWGFRSAAKALEEAHASKDPKVIGEACRETEKQLLALNSIEKSRNRFESYSTLLSETEKQSRMLKSAERSRNRFRAARELLFLVAIHSAQEEIQKYSDAKNYDAAYGIARKLAVDWFATAEMLGADKAKLLETLRENCRFEVEAADAAGDLPEVAPLPRSREIAPPPRIKS